MATKEAEHSGGSRGGGLALSSNAALSSAHRDCEPLASRRTRRREALCCCYSGLLCVPLLSVQLEASGGGGYCAARLRATATFPAPCTYCHEHCRLSSPASRSVLGVSAVFSVCCLSLPLALLALGWRLVCGTRCRCAMSDARIRMHAYAYVCMLGDGGGLGVGLRRSACCVLDSPFPPCG